MCMGIMGMCMLLLVYCSIYYLRVECIFIPLIYRTKERDHVCMSVFTLNIYIFDILDGRVSNHDPVKYMLVSFNGSRIYAYSKR